MGFSGNTVCELNKCTGCMVCVDICPKCAVTIIDSVQAYNAKIDENKCVECGLCHKVCQNNNEMEKKPPISWFQGWIKDEKLRSLSSSGGAAKALSIKFIRDGGYVCSCCFSEGEFRFYITNNLDDVNKFTGSKYVKSSPSGIYKRIEKLLKNEESVLFIGLPCQVGALKIYLKGEYEDRLYTVDLICHGTPSPKLLNAYLNQKKIDIMRLEDISFRYKGGFGLSLDYSPLVQPGAVDRYLLAFLCNIDYTDNCYECKYAGSDRISDITIGDSWGSELEDAEKNKGISLILCQTEKGRNLLKTSDMVLFDVDLEKAKQANDQLRAPSIKSEKHDRFFSCYKNDDFKQAVFSSLPDKCVKQVIKACLLKCGLLKARGGI